MGGSAGIIIIIGVSIGVVCLIRLLGAWMLRIDVVIDELKKANRSLREIKDKD
jgi:hypothetical protein